MTDNVQRAYDREEQQLERDLYDGLITQADFNAEVKAMAREYRDAADEAAQDAYDRERDRW